MLKTNVKEVIYAQMLGTKKTDKTVRLKITNSENEYGKNETMIVMEIEDWDDKKIIPFFSKEQLIDFCGFMGALGEEVRKSDTEFYFVGPTK